jgi:type IX secretion system PorP/SprF family membrane protein
MKKLLSIFFLFVLLSLNMHLSSHAQDPHFSQYFSSPLTLNPANTGNFQGPSRLSMNFRNQWQGLGNPYVTGTGSFDTEIFKKKSGKGNKFAFGITGLYDKTTAGKLTSNYVSASIGYHLFTDVENTSKLSIGFQSTLVNRKLDFTKISFADQFTSYGFDLNLPSNQTFQTGNISYTDFNTGLMYSQVKENASVYVGASAYHLTRPNESFLNDQTNRVPIRYTLHGGGTWNTSDRSMIMGSGLMMSQGGINQLVLGVAYGRQIENKNSDIKVFIGGWYRNKDAFIPYFGYTYDNFQLGVSYDVNTSQLSISGTRYKSFEISMIYHFLDKSEYRRFVPWY